MYIKWRIVDVYDLNTGYVLLRHSTITDTRKQSSTSLVYLLSVVASQRWFSVWCLLKERPLTGHLFPTSEARAGLPYTQSASPRQFQVQPIQSLSSWCQAAFLAAQPKHFLLFPFHHLAGCSPSSHTVMPIPEMPFLQVSYERQGTKHPTFLFCLKGCCWSVGLC